MSRRARNSIVRRFVAEDGLQLSDRAWRLDRHARDIIVNAIEMAVIQGHGATQAALFDQGRLTQSMIRAPLATPPPRREISPRPSAWWWIRSAPGAIEVLRQAVGAAVPIVVAVQALEETGVNAIPTALAGIIARRLGLPVEDSIVQINRVGHTGADGYHRLANPALFDGEVRAGARYLLVDDFVGQGGTLANLRGYAGTGGQMVDVNVNKQFAERVLARYDAQHGARLRAEHKRLTAGDGKKVRLFLGQVVKAVTVCDDSVHVVEYYPERIVGRAPGDVVRGVRSEWCVAPRPGLEPGTCGLTVRRSTD